GPILRDARGSHAGPALAPRWPAPRSRAGSPCLPRPGRATPHELAVARRRAARAPPAGLRPVRPRAPWVASRALDEGDRHARNALDSSQRAEVFGLRRFD